jgi:carboxylesterase
MLASRVEKVVVMGLSMGGTLTLWLAAQHPNIAGIVCVNPAAQAMPEEIVSAIQGMLTEGTEVIPGIGSDIADPDTTENAYSGTPIRPLLSFIADGLKPLAQRLPEIKVPLLLFTSTQDHVVSPADSDFIVATYGGAVEQVKLERSYHVATQDFDKQLIFDGAVNFAFAVAES